MLRRLIRDEVGMTMGLAVIMIVLIGVMGAGLLTFVQRDLGSVVENNKGQRAFELAEAGVQVAKEQLQDDSIPAHYNGGTDAADLRWSKFYSGGQGMRLTNLDGSSATSDSVSVTIEYRTGSVDTFVAVSTGTYGDAKRKIEAVFKRTGAIMGIPPAYYTRSSVTLSGNVTAHGVSFFARKDGKVSGSFTFGTEDDVLKKWAETGDSDSYPNPFNGTPRSLATPGIAVGNVLTLEGSGVIAQVQKGSRSFDKDTNPSVVPTYPWGDASASSKIAFPFSTSSLPDDLEVLRQKAIQQETQPGNTVDYYQENLAVGTHPITSWPTNSDYGTVFYYRFPTYHSSNTVTWDVSLPCTDASRKGVIVVENGDFVLTGNRGGFNGTVLVYGRNDPATGHPYPNEGNFSSSGSGCMTGYASSTGDMSLSGTYTASNVPGLNELPLFQGAMKPSSWRELYE